MPLFFFVSGITFEKFSKYNNVKELKKLIWRRVINLVVPTLIFIVGLLLVFGTKKNVIFYYDNVWFLIHLTFIFLIIGIAEFLKLKEVKIERVLVAIDIIFLVFFGSVQIVLRYLNYDVLSKYAQEVGKFFLYLLCFILGRFLIKNKIKFSKVIILIAFVIFMIFQIIAVLFELDDKLVFLKMLCGISGSFFFIGVYSQYRKKCVKIEKYLAMYSLEIYLIHSDIIHGVLREFDIKLSLLGACIVFVLDIIIPLGIAYLEKYLLPLDFIFHPCKYLKLTLNDNNERE